MSGKKDPSTGSTVIDGLFDLDWLLLFQRSFGFLWSVVVELCRGLVRGTMPVIPCLVAGAAISLAVRYDWDYLFLRRFGIEWLYPVGLWNSTTYRVALLFSGCVGWAVFRAVRKIGDRNRAKEVFENAGLN